MFAKEMMQFCVEHSIDGLGVVISTEIAEHSDANAKITSLK